MRIRIYRCDPSNAQRSHYDDFEIPLREKMSVLDALVAIQAEQDPTLSFRYSCRAGICGTCAMMVNGVPRWTCRTSLASLGGKTVTVAPLRYFPVIKDLAVDMSILFGKFRDVIPHVAQREKDDRPAVIRPTERGRVKIADYLECIGCGCCYAACELPALDSEYLGPHALNRVYTLIHDRRDAACEQRLQIVDNEHGCWRCHTQTSCMDVCPKDINTSDAIQDLKREVLAYRRDRQFVPEAAEIPEEAGAKTDFPSSPARREFLYTSAAGVVGIMALALGVPLAYATLSPAVSPNESEQWIELGWLDKFPVGGMVETRCRAQSSGGWSDRPASKAVYVLRRSDGDFQALSPSCTHLGCPVRWREVSRCFVCPCHGGIFDETGKNVGGPPKRPLARIATRIERDRLYLRGSS